MPTKLMNGKRVQQTAKDMQFMASVAQHAAVPQLVTRHQFIIALHHAGLLNQMGNALMTLNTVTVLEWEHAIHFRRQSDCVAAIATALVLTAQQVDDLFVAAAAID